MAYTEIDKPSDYLRIQTWSGNNSADREITWTETDNMQPDWIWVKRRSDTANHRLADSVRGATKILRSDTNGAETTESDDTLSFDTNGFSVGSNSGVNKTGDTYVGWGWKAGTSFTNDASSTGIGTIDSAGSFNNDSGFSIVSYTGNNTSGATLKHGLNTAPAMVIVKNRNRTDNRDWVVYHQKLTSASYYIYLNSTGAMAGAYANFWNNTAPNSSVITLGSGDTTTNGNGDTYIAYCFAEKKGYSKFGNYTGNGNADGTFVYTGFKPAWIMTKITSGADDWQICDNKRDPDNAVFSQLNANSSAAQNDGDAKVDFTSQGFKIRKAGGSWNASGGSFIYMAFAENPFVTGASAIPTTAR